MFSSLTFSTFIIITIIMYITGLVDAAMQNLSCYQCTRTTNTECRPDELLPCPSNTDRCVTHIMKDDDVGFKISRECGLGPCTFNDLMSSKALGIDTCDRSRHEYFCLFCCRENGCNKGGVANITPKNLFIFINTLFVLIATLCLN